ncbi:MAG: SDR family oxidoreductase [Acidobacteriota bacterium]
MSDPSRPVLVTGASRGIGRAIALELAAAGFSVWAGVRSQAAAAELTSLAKARRTSIRPVLLEVTSKDSIENAVGTIGETHGRLFGLVNNAGITGRAFFEDYPDEFVRKIFDVNLFGAMDVTRRALPLLRANKGARIVMISSIGGRIGSNSVAPYCASKFALEGFAESLSIEVKPFGIDVTIVSPGIVRTEIWDEATRILPEARNPASPCYEYFWRMEGHAARLLESSRVTPEQVAQRVLRTMLAKRPRLRYIVGRRAAIVASLRRHLPGELFERLYFGEFVRRMTARTTRLPPVSRDEVA